MKRFKKNIIKNLSEGCRESIPKLMTEIKS
jgi:hypothetical protein